LRFSRLAGRFRGAEIPNPTKASKTAYTVSTQAYLHWEMLAEEKYREQLSQTQIAQLEQPYLNWNY
jgi:hypothetical protein